MPPKLADGGSVEDLPGRVKQLIADVPTHPTSRFAVWRLLSALLVIAGIAIAVVAAANVWLELGGAPLVAPNDPAEPLPIPGEKPPAEFGLPQAEGAAEFRSGELSDGSYVFLSYAASDVDAAAVVAFYRDRLAAAGWAFDRQIPISIARPTFNAPDPDAPPAMMTGFEARWKQPAPHRRLILEVYDSKTPAADVNVVLKLRRLPD